MLNIIKFNIKRAMSAQSRWRSRERLDRRKFKFSSRDSGKCCEATQENLHHVYEKLVVKHITHSWNKGQTWPLLVFFFQIVEYFSKIILIALLQLFFLKWILSWWVFQFFLLLLSEERNALHAEATSLIILSSKNCIVIYSLSRSVSIDVLNYRLDVHTRNGEHFSGLFFPSIVCVRLLLSALRPQASSS